MIVVSLPIVVTSEALVWGDSRVAYIYDNDTASRDSFNTFLTGRNFVVDLVPLSSAATFDFSSDQTIIIGNDTGYTDTWGTPATVSNINGAGKPILGIGEGGYAFLGKLSLAIGYPQGAHGSYNGADVVATADPIWSSPFLIPNGGVGSTVTVYRTAVKGVVINNPDVVPGVLRLGRRAGGGTYLLIGQVIADHCYELWGFGGSPAGMTSVGKNLFYNSLARPCGGPMLSGLTVPTPFPAMTVDFNGDGKADIAIYGKSTGTWYLDFNGNMVWDGPGVDAVIGWGGDASDIPVVGDWNGSGTTKIGVYRQSTGTWYLDLNGNRAWDGCGVDAVIGWGGDASDIPVVGDWNGSGTTKIGVYRQSTGTWYLDLNGNRTWDGCGTDGCIGWGGDPSDIPVVGDWNGSGTTKIGVYRQSTGTWYLDLNGNRAWDGCGTDGCIGWGGDPSDIPVVGDWNGSGTTKIGVYRQSTGTWYLDLNGNRAWDGCGDRRLHRLGWRSQ